MLVGVMPRHHSQGCNQGRPVPGGLDVCVLVAAQSPVPLRTGVAIFPQVVQLA